MVPLSPVRRSRSTCVRMELIITESLRYGLKLTQKRRDLWNHSPKQFALLMWKARHGGNISTSFFSTIEQRHIAQQDLHQQNYSSIEKFETNFHNFCLGIPANCLILVQRWRKMMTGPKSKWKHMPMQKWEQRHPPSTLAIRYLLDRESTTSSQHVSIPYLLELCPRMERWLQHVTMASISLAMCLISKYVVNPVFQGEESNDEEEEDDDTVSSPNSNLTSNVSDANVNPPQNGLRWSTRNCRPVDRFGHYVYGQWLFCVNFPLFGQFSVQVKGRCNVDSHCIISNILLCNHLSRDHWENNRMPCASKAVNIHRV